MTCSVVALTAGGKSASLCFAGFYRAFATNLTALAYRCCIWFCYKVLRCALLASDHTLLTDFILFNILYTTDLVELLTVNCNTVS